MKIINLYPTAFSIPGISHVSFTPSPSGENAFGIKRSTFPKVTASETNSGKHPLNKFSTMTLNSLPDGIAFKLLICNMFELAPE